MFSNLLTAIVVGSLVDLGFGDLKVDTIGISDGSGYE